MLQPGDQVDRYVVSHMIEISSSTERYCVNAPDGAVRMLEVLPVSSPGLTQSIRDANLLGLTHPNVVAIHDVIDMEGSPGLVCDISDEMTLRNWLAEPTTLDVSMALFCGIVSAVAYGQELGLLHLELRAGTIRVSTRPNGTFFALVEGLGITKLVFTAMQDKMGLSTSKGGLAEPRHAAPEAIRKPHLADARSDMYSLGCLLYEMLGGAHPFAGLGYYDLYLAKREERYVALNEINAAVDPNLNEIVADLLRAAPDARIQSAAELLERLDSLEQGSASGSSLRPVEKHPLSAKEGDAAVMSGGYLVPAKTSGSTDRRLMWAVALGVALAGIVLLAAVLWLV